MIWVEHVVQTGDIRNTYRVLDGKPEEKTPFGKPMPRREDNIKGDIIDAVWEVVHFTCVAQDGGVWGVHRTR
jgi:hypothetical protein